MELYTKYNTKFLLIHFYNQGKLYDNKIFMIVNSYKFMLQFKQFDKSIHINEFKVVFIHSSPINLFSKISKRGKKGDQNSSFFNLIKNSQTHNFKHSQGAFLKAERKCDSHNR